MHIRPEWWSHTFLRTNNCISLHQYWSSTGIVFCDNDVQLRETASFVLHVNKSSFIQCQRQFSQLCPLMFNNSCCSSWYCFDSGSVHPTIHIHVHCRGRCSVGQDGGEQNQCALCIKGNSILIILKKCISKGFYCLRALQINQSMGNTGLDHQICSGSLYTWANGPGKMCVGNTFAYLPAIAKCI